MSEYQTETQILREGLFRFGQWFNLQNLKYSYYRNPIAKLICVNVVNDALRKGWDIVEPGTEKTVDWNLKAQKYIKMHLPELLQAYYFARRDGEALLGAFEYGEGDSKTFIVRAFPKGDYTLKMGPNGAIESGKATSKYVNHSEHIPHVINEENRDSFVKVILKRRDRQNEGLSELENVWDVMFAIEMLLSHSAYFVARAGAGIKEVVIPESESDQADTLMSTLLTTAAQYGAAHDVAFRPKTIGGQEIEFNMKTVDNPVDFMSYFDMYTFMISSSTGIPSTIVKGAAFEGEKEGAVVSEEGYFDVLRDIQFITEGHNKWFMHQLNGQYQFDSTIKLSDEEEKFDLLYATRKVMSVAEELELLVKKAEAVKALRDAGLKTIEAFKQAKFTDVTPAMIEEKPEMMELSSGNGRPVGGSEEGRPFPPTKSESKTENNPEMLGKK